MDLYPNSWILNFSALSSGPCKTSNSFSINFFTASRSDLMKVMTLTPKRSSMVSKGSFWYLTSFKIFFRKLSNFFTRNWRICNVSCFLSSLSSISSIRAPNFWKLGLNSIYFFLILPSSISFLNSDLNSDKIHHLRLSLKLCCVRLLFKHFRI